MGVEVEGGIMRFVDFTVEGILSCGRGTEVRGEDIGTVEVRVIKDT